MATATLKYQPMTEEEMRVHALNLAVAGRKDVTNSKSPSLMPVTNETFADICVNDAEKYLTFLRGDTGA